MEWTDEVITRLRALWAEGHSTAEIGRRMGVSKNAVVGKAHRLDLPARPSPIRRESGERAPRRPIARRVVGPTLPPLPTTEAAPMVLDPPARRTDAVVVSRPAVVRTGFRFSPCCWPIGEPGTKTFRFCDAEAASGKPYCGDHAQLAYVKVRDRREEAA